MRSYGPRVDPDTGTLHMRVRQAHDYDRQMTLWRRKVGNGHIDCKMLRASSGPARRIIQLHATYTDAGVLTMSIVTCENELDEAIQISRLEARVLAASSRPTSPDQQPE